MFFDTNFWRRINYAVLAPIYDRLAGGFAGARRRSIELAGIQSGQRVLLVGAGTGLDLPLLPGHARYTAVDLSAPMLSRLRRRSDELELDVDAQVADAMDLPFEDDSFDVVLLHLIASVVPDARRCLAEAWRVLAPDGRVVVLDKFLPRGGAKAMLVRLMHPLASFFGSGLKLRRQDVLLEGRFQLEREEPGVLGGLWQILVLRPGQPTDQAGSMTTRTCPDSASG
jgi:ubiquinone/menaquinone biosynthesis C-methylase UbiE